MTETPERLEPTRRAPAELQREALAGQLAELASMDAPGFDRPTGGRGVEYQPDADFHVWREIHRGEGPQRYERPDDRLPWTEHPVNGHLEDYDWHPDLEQQVQEAYAEHGLDAATVERINAIRFEKDTPNCGECARSVASTIDGCPRAAAAIGGSGEDLADMEAWAGRRFDAPQGLDEKLSAIDRDLARQGDGHHGIIAGSREEAVGHYVNAARIDGRTVIIDSQNGGAIMQLDEARAYLHRQEIVELQWLRLNGERDD